MARLSSYSKDIAITGDDKLIGSNYGGLDNQGRPIFTTANYKISDLLIYFQENISTSGINITGIRNFQLNLAGSLGTYSSDGTLSSLSSAFVNQFATAEAGNKFATSTFQTNMETSVLTFDGSGNATVAEAFANQIITTTSSNRFATSTYAQNIGSSFGTVASDGTVTLSEAFANSVMTTTSSDRFATSSKLDNVIASVGTDDGEGNITLSASFANSVITATTSDRFATSEYAQNLGSSVGTVDSSGNITVSEAFANSVMNTETATDYASSSSVTSLASTVSTKPDIFRQISAPSTSNAVGSLWYDTDDNNKVYVLVAGDPNVWTLTDDSRIGSLVTSTATINQTLNTHTSDISANATFATGLASSFGTYDSETGEITALSTSFANAVMTTENTTDYAAASDVTELNTQFVFTNGEITGTSGAISTEIASAQSNATNAAASKVEDLAANFFTGYDAADGSYTATSLSADFKTAVNAEVDANSSTADYVSNLSAAVGIDKTDGSTLQATAYINNATVYTTTATVNGAVASSKEVTITASNSNIEVGQYVTYSTQSSDSNNDIVWRVIGVSGTTITLDNEIVLENATTLTFTGKSTYNIDGVSGNIVDGFQVKGTGITVGTFVTDYTSPALTLNRAEVLSDDTALEFLGVYAAVKETASVLAGIDGNLKSTYGMQVDANGNIASMKLIADNTGSEISFLADTFKVYNGTDAGVAPFEIVDGVVKIKSANIGDVSFGDLTNIPDTFVITIVYADDASGTNQSLTKGSYNYYGIYQGQAALTTNDLPVSGVTFNQITGTSGTNGIDAKVVKLTPSKHVINYDTDGTESDSITFTTEVQNITNSVTYRFDIVNNAGSVTTGTASATSTFTLNDADEPAEGERTTVKVYVFENGTQVATDSVTIYAVKDGSSAVTGFLTNASHTCSADNDGGNPVLTGSGGDFKVFVGGTDVSSSCTFSVVSYTSGLTITIDSSSGAYTITGLTVDTATAVLKAVVPAATAGTADNVEITQIYSISKSIKGNTGTTGATGPTGARVYTTNLFYQTIVTDSSTPTFDDSSLDYDFDTASWSGIPSGWAVNPPSSSPGSGTNKLYYVSVSVIEGDPDNTLSVGSPTTYFNFNGLVTFTGAGNTTLTDGSNNFNYTAIDGAYITTGAITSHDFTYTDANTSGSFQETETVTNGMIIDLDGNYIKSPSLWLKSDGSAIFSGEVNILDASDDTVVKVHNGSTFTDLTVDADAVSYSNITNLEVSTWASSDTTISGSGTTIGTLAGDDPYEYIYGNSNSATFSTGAYNHTITTAAITSSIISTNSSFDNGGYIYLYLGVQFGNSNFSTIYLDKVLGSSSITGPNQTLTFPATSNDISLAFSTSTTAYIRFYWRRVWKTANGAGTCAARALDITSDLSFDGTKGLAELSPSGMQVTVADNIYFKVNRSGYDLTSPYVDIAGNTKIDGNLEVTGNINITGDVENSDVSVDKLQSRLSQISSNTFIGDSSNSSTFTVRDNLIIDGNLTVNGTTVTVNTTNLSVADNLIHVGDNNNLNTVDLGIIGHYSNDSGVTANHVGLFWDASATKWKFFETYTKDELGSATVDTAHASFSLGDVEAGSFTGSSFIKSGGTGSQFLKADGSIDSNTYLTSQTDTLDSVTDRGATTTNAITVGGLTVDTDTLYVDAANNRVGIGTTSPDVKLEVIDASPTNGVIADFVNSTNAGGTIAAIKLSNADSEACDVILGANRVGANFGSDFFISLSDGVDGTNQERFRITEAGNVTVSTGNLNVSAGDLQIGGVTTITNARAITGSSLSVTNGISSSTATISQVNAGFISTTNDITLSNTKGILASGTVNVGYASITSTSDGLTFDARAGASNKSAFTVSNSAGTKQLVVDKYGGGTSYFEGSLGIGTSSPSDKLSVSDLGAANGTSSQTASFVNSTVGATSSYLYLGAYSGTDWKIGKNVLGTASRTNFDITDHAGNLALTINNSTRNVGIGTTSPDSKLDVFVTSGDSNQVRISANENVYKDLQWKDTTSGEMWIWSHRTNGDGNKFMAWYYNGASYNSLPAITFDTNNNIGIGTNSPAYQLDVNGTARVQGYNSLTLNGVELKGYPNNNLWFISNNSGEAQFVVGTSWDWDRQVEFRYNPATIGTPDGTLSIGQLQKNAGTWTHGNTTFYTNGTARMRLDSAGNLGVGIGTNPTNAILTNSGRGNITINGSADSILTLGINGTAKAWFYTTASNTYLSGSSTLVFETGGVSNRLNIDSSGMVTVNAGAVGAKKFRVYYDMDVYNTVNLTDSSWNIQGRITPYAGNGVRLQGTSGSTFDFNSTNGYFYAPSWINIGGGAGIFSSTNGAHFYPNTYSTYGAWRMNGDRGSYGGLLVYDVANKPHVMFDSSGNGGFYTEGNGVWPIYYHVGNNSVGIGGSTTQSGYAAYVNGNARAIGEIVAGASLVTVQPTYQGIYGAASFSWAGSTAYPTIYSSNADRWVMICYPHIPYQQNGVNGYTGNTVGSTINFASDSSTTTYWGIGVNPNNTGNNDQFTISRQTSRLFYINQYGDLNINAWIYNSSSVDTYYNSYGYGYRPAGASNTYGNITTYNTGQGAWSGYSIHHSNTSFMGSANSDVGIYNASQGDWGFYYTPSTRGVGLMTSVTSSTYEVYIGGDLYATGDIVAYSDRRVKENIINIDSALDKVKALQGVYYNRINDKDKVREIGFIAQDVHDAVPELASYAEDVDEWGVKYSQVTGLHNEAIKELAQQLDKKDEQIANLQAQIDELKQLIYNK